MITYCDVNTCEECPRYGDDCDGSAERLYTHEEAWGMCDYISRADAIDAVTVEFADVFDMEEYDTREVAVHALKELPSAEAEPIVIRSRTLMPTKDFKEWAKRVRDENPNVIVIPCDAEVVSAEAVQKGW